MENIEKTVKIRIDLQNTFSDSIAVLLQRGAVSGCEYYFEEGYPLKMVTTEQAIDFFQKLKDPEEKIRFVLSYCEVNCYINLTYERSIFCLEITSREDDGINYNGAAVREFYAQEIDLIETLDVEFYLRVALLLCRDFIIEAVDVKLLTN